MPYTHSAADEASDAMLNAVKWLNNPHTPMAIPISMEIEMKTM